MSITNKRPMIKETVGGLYYAFNKMTEKGEFNPDEYEGTTRSDVVKTIKTTENSENGVVRASGGDYVSASQTATVEQAVEVVAFDPEDLAKMRGDDINKSGLIFSGAPAQRPYFAFGKVAKKNGGGLEFVWYPKCQLVENTDDIETSEESFKEQNDTVTIKAFSFDKKGNKSVRVNNETSVYPEGLTEEKFFEKPILTEIDLSNALAPETPGA